MNNKKTKDQLTTVFGTSGNITSDNAGPVSLAAADQLAKVAGTLYHLQNSLESAHIGSWSFDLSRGILFVCKHSAGLLPNIESSCIVPDSFLAYIGEEQGETIKRAFRDAYKNGTTVDQEIRILSVGEIKWLRLTALFVVDEMETVPLMVH